MSLPYVLILLRALSAVFIPICAVALTHPGSLIVALVWIGLVSDIFDGIIARGMGIATARLRQLDSQVDAVFWLAILITALALHFEGMAQHLGWVAGLVVVEAVIYAVNFARFGRAGSTHAYSAKLFGLFLLAAFSEVFLTGFAGGWFQAMLVVGTVAQLEGLAIALALPSWRHDVKSIFFVWLARRDESLSAKN